MEYTRVKLSEVLALFQFFFVSAGLIFLWAAISGNYPMKPEIYGDAVYWLDAEIWASMLVAGHCLAALGLWLERCFVAFVGALFTVFIYIAFAALALSAQFGDLVVIFSGFVNGPMHLTVAIICLLECRAKIRAQNDG